LPASTAGAKRNRKLAGSIPALSVICHLKINEHLASVRISDFSGLAAWGNHSAGIMAR
jgi:hypothetical protein